MSREETQILWCNKNLYLQLLSREQQRSAVFPSGTNWLPAAGETQTLTPRWRTALKCNNNHYASRVILLYSYRKSVFILITWALSNKMKIWALHFCASLRACSPLKCCKLIVICAAPRQLCAVHSVHCPSSWVRNKGGGRCGRQGKTISPFPLIFVYSQQTTTKVLLSQFSVARRWAPGRRRQRDGAMMKSQAVQGRCFLGLLGAWEYTCPLLTHCDGSMKH